MTEPFWIGYALGFGSAAIIGGLLGCLYDRWHQREWDELEAKIEDWGRKLDA